MGDVREDGFVFRKYKYRKKKSGFFYEQWSSPEAFESEKQKDAEWRREYSTARYRTDENYRNRMAEWRRSYKDKLLLTKEGHIKLIYVNRKSDAKIKNIPFDISLEHVIEIAPDHCPVFGEPLLWAQRNGHLKSMSPTLDKIDPTLGYVPGNVQWLSSMANLMKQNATPAQLIKFSEWCIKNFKDK